MKKWFSNLEFKLLIFLLKRYVTHELDQWERWKINTKYGDCFIQITRETDGCGKYEELKAL